MYTIRLFNDLDDTSSIDIKVRGRLAYISLEMNERIVEMLTQLYSRRY